MSSRRARASESIVVQPRCSLVAGVVKQQRSPLLKRSGLKARRTQRPGAHKVWLLKPGHCNSYPTPFQAVSGILGPINSKVEERVLLAWCILITTERKLHMHRSLRAFARLIYSEQRPLNPSPTKRASPRAPHHQIRASAAHRQMSERKASQTNDKSGCARE
jgi:hypothetical protein